MRLLAFITIGALAALLWRPDPAWAEGYTLEIEDAHCEICPAFGAPDTAGEVAELEKARAIVNCIDYKYLKNTRTEDRSKLMNYQGDEVWEYEEKRGNAEFSNILTEKIDLMFAMMFGEEGLQAKQLEEETYKTHLVCKALYHDARGACATVLGAAHPACK